MTVKTIKNEKLEYENVRCEIYYGNYGKAGLKSLILRRLILKISGKCHQISQGGGRGQPRCHETFFQKEIGFILVLLTALNYSFFKIQMSRHQTGEKGGTGQCHKMTQSGDVCI